MVMEASLDREREREKEKETGKESGDRKPEKETADIFWNTRTREHTNRGSQTEGDGEGESDTNGHEKDERNGIKRGLGNGSAITTGRSQPNQHTR